MMIGRLMESVVLEADSNERLSSDASYQVGRHVRYLLIKSDEEYGAM
jgi:hypothetical protein